MRGTAILIGAGLGALLALGCRPAAPSRTTGAFVTTLGDDTVAFERYTRSGNRLEGELVTTSPRTRVSRYVVDFDLQGSVSRYELTVSDPGGGPPALSAAADIGSGSITSVLHRGDKVDTVTLTAGQDVFPAALYAWGLSELATEALARSDRDSLALEQYSAGAQRTSEVDVVRRGDSVSMSFFGSPMMLAIDSSGRVLGADGAHTTVKVRVARVDSLNMDGLIAAFAGRDQSGHSLGTLSPRDTVRAAVGRAELLVDYGRPSVRGRRIVGGIVPYDQVWRTGANAATQFSTNRPLTFGSLAVPAGTYTLWTRPTTNGVSLIINRQTGQWGTDYDAGRDLGRGPMQVDSLASPVERFTISIEATADGAGALRLDWDRTRWVAPFRVR
jgi:Protein of unknown function (DUF2911)